MILWPNVMMWLKVMLWLKVICVKGDTVVKGEPIDSFLWCRIEKLRWKISYTIWASQFFYSIKYYKIFFIIYKCHLSYL